MTRKSLPRQVVAVVLAGLAFSGCGRSNSAGSDGGSHSSGLEKEAENFAMTEIKKHWAKIGEGWVTARTVGSAYAPDHVIRQCRDLVLDSVRASGLSDADRMNGVEWEGEVSVQKTPCREAGDPGVMLDGLEGAIMRQRNRWTRWVDFQPEPVRLQKVKGQWHCNEDSWLLRGTSPTAREIANAGVKP